MTTTYCVRPNGSVNSSFCNVSCIGYVCTPCIPMCQPFNDYQDSVQICCTNCIPTNKSSVFILNCDYQRCLPKSPPECHRKIKFNEIRLPPMGSAYNLDRCSTSRHCMKFQPSVNVYQRKYEHRAGSASALCKQIKTFKSRICGNENIVCTSEVENEAMSLDEEEEPYLSIPVICDGRDKGDLQCVQSMENPDVLTPLSRTFPEYYDPSAVEVTERIPKICYTLPMQNQEQCNTLGIQNERPDNIIVVHQDQRPCNTLGVQDERPNDIIVVQEKRCNKPLGVQGQRPIRNVTTSTVVSRSTKSSEFGGKGQPKRTESKSSKQLPTVAARNPKRSPRENHDIAVTQKRRYPPLAFNIPERKAMTGIMTKGVGNLVQRSKCRHSLRRACQIDDYSPGFPRFQMNFCKQDQNVACKNPCPGSHVCGPIYCLNQCTPEAFRKGRCFEICNLNCGIKREIPHSNCAGRIYMCSRINSRVPQLPSQSKRNWCINPLRSMFCVVAGR